MTVVAVLALWTLCICESDSSNGPGLISGEGVSGVGPLTLQLLVLEAPSAGGMWVLCYLQSGARVPTGQSGAARVWHLGPRAKGIKLAGGSGDGGGWRGVLLCEEERAGQPAEPPPTTTTTEEGGRIEVWGWGAASLPWGHRPRLTASCPPAA